MLHTIAHYGMLVASAFSGICGIILLLLLAITVDYYAGIGLLIRREPERDGVVATGLVWEVPVVCAGLTAFWAAVAYGLHLV